MSYIKGIVAASLAAAVSMGSAVAQEEKVLHVYNWSDYIAEDTVANFEKETGIKGKNLFMPIRIAVSGEMHGPELPDTIYLLGKEKAVNHLAQFIK